MDACFKGKGTCIDFILTNGKYSFKNTNNFETGLSDHHHMICTMLKSAFEKATPIKLTYRDYKKLSFDRFKADLENALKTHTIVLNSVFLPNVMNILLKNKVGKRE